MAPEADCPGNSGTKQEEPFTKPEKNLLQSSPKLLFPSLVIFAPAVAYHYSLKVSVKFLQPGNDHLAEPCSGTPTGSLSHLRTMLPESSSQPLPAQWSNHAT